MHRPNLRVLVGSAKTTLYQMGLFCSRVTSTGFPVGSTVLAKRMSLIWPSQLRHSLYPSIHVREQAFCPFMAFRL